MNLISHLQDGLLNYGQYIIQAGVMRGARPRTYMRVEWCEGEEEGAILVTYELTPSNGQWKLLKPKFSRLKWSFNHRCLTTM